MLSHLPEEILVEILARLPVENLISCACTCKFLFSFITSPNFIHIHFQKSNKNHILIKYYSKEARKEVVKLIPDDHEYLVGHCFEQDIDLNEIEISVYECFAQDYKELELTFGNLNTRFSVVGCCAGVICLCDDSLEFTRIVLWNPSIRKLVALYRPDIENPAGGMNMSSLGFGFDEAVDDYKVIHLLYQGHTTEIELPPVVHVYALSSGTWRSIEESSCPMRHVFNAANAQCFLNGFVHWPAYNYDDNTIGNERNFDGSSDSKNVILTFDLHKEIFGEMEMPDTLASCDDFWLDLTVGVCRDMLSLVRYANRTWCGISNVADTCSIWVMKEYAVADSWMKVFEIDVLSGSLRPTAFAFTTNEDLLALMGRSIGDTRQVVVSFDPRKTVAKILGQIDATVNSIYLGGYVESLALFKEGKAILDEKVQPNIEIGDRDGRADSMVSAVRMKLQMKSRKRRRSKDRQI